MPCFLVSKANVFTRSCVYPFPTLRPLPTSFHEEPPSELRQAVTPPPASSVRGWRGSTATVSTFVAESPRLEGAHERPPSVDRKMPRPFVAATIDPPGPGVRAGTLGGGAPLLQRVQPLPPSSLRKVPSAVIASSALWVRSRKSAVTFRLPRATAKVQLSAASAERKTPPSVAAQSRDGSFASTTSAFTFGRARPRLAGFHVSPPSVLFAIPRRRVAR